jgi:hypothetical protein
MPSTRTTPPDGRPPVPSRGPAPPKTQAATEAARVANLRRGLDRAVQAIADRAPALSEAQVARLRQILSTAEPLPPR